MFQHKDPTGGQSLSDQYGFNQIGVSIKIKGRVSQNEIPLGRAPLQKDGSL